MARRPRDKSYVPPVHQFRLRQLPPHPDVDGAMIWIAYYLWWSPNPRYAQYCAIALVGNVLMFLAYLRFVKYMERP